MGKISDSVLGRKFSGTRIVPVVLKIVLIFALFIMVSNLASNYINLMLNRTELIKLMKQLLVKDLKQIYSFSNNQKEIYEYSKDLQGSVTNIEEFTLRDLPNKRSIALGIKSDGSLLFQGLKIPRQEHFTDKAALQTMVKNLENGIYEDSLTLLFNRDTYFGVYKYHLGWDIFLIRAEELNEFYSQSAIIFRNISIIILVVTIASAFVGILLLQYTLKYVGVITNSILSMQQSQELKLIDMKGATSDDITYLGLSFNALSSTINNLLTIFRKFVTQDVALSAYRDKFVRLEGYQQELTILFSDIKSFTFITETLGPDIIKLLNLHYERAISNVEANSGIIGSIIGDALLAVFGTLTSSHENKSHQAVISAYQIQDAAASLRKEMTERKLRLEKKHQGFTDEEEKFYKAVLLEVGVGIDGGEVYYGKIGSRGRMTNTVIGDNVNSASRLEGLTRIYKVPVICSDYVKADIEENVRNSGMQFVELDQVQVKGKTIGKRVYWPVPGDQLNDSLKRELGNFIRGLELYYGGDWEKAGLSFKRCKLPMVEVFIERTKHKCPRDWNGIWTMTTK
ncbi:MAG TPA: adenylate/guanylate cyclase domain-containing protein [Spirochaetia bacterium]|nr:adenylate/guanylate cyclase domain-containing protein [Spirochaetia bacterium]